MSSLPTTTATPDLLRRAYANLKSIRENLSGGYVHDEGLFNMFATALNQLQQAGVDVREWRMPHDAIGNIGDNEFRARIDAILIYFIFRQENTQIGFHN